MSKEFIGWIPNLRGRLSFSTIGSSTRPYPYVDLSSDNCRILVQKRTLNDSAIPRIIRKVLFECNYSPLVYVFKFIYFLSTKANHDFKALEKLLFHTGDFQFVYIEKEVKQEAINGTVYILYKPETFLKNRVYESAGAIVDKISSKFLLKSDFYIERDGIVRLKNHHMHEIKESELQWVAPSNGDKKDEFIISTVEQIYFFLKDLCHEHQHHDAKSDSLLPLIESKNDEMKDLYESVLKWLYRVILKKRRERSLEEYKSISGILVYIQSFKRIMNKRSKESILETDFCNEGDKLLANSIKTKSDQLEISHHKKNSLSTALPNALALTISLIAVIFSVSSPLLFYVSKQEEYKDKLLNILNNDLLEGYLSIIKIIYGNPVAIFTILFMFIVFFILVINPWFWDTKFLQDIKRISYAIGHRNLQITISIIMGTVLILIGLNILL